MQRANQALALAKKLESGVEQKFVYAFFSSDQITSNGAVFPLNETIVGDADFGERTGDSIHCVSIVLRLQVFQPVTLLNSHAIRIIIINDKQATLANAGNLLSGVGSTNCPMIPYDKDFRLRHTVYWDSESIALDTYNPSQTLFWKRKINVRTRYFSGSNRITTGRLLAVMLTDTDPSSPEYPRVTGTIRVNYTDV